MPSPTPSPQATHRPPAYCERCKLIFAAAAFAMTNTTLEITNCATNCPRCGGPAKVLDGTYAAFEERFNIALAPSVSPEALAALFGLIQQVQAKKLDLPKARRKAERIHPGLGRIFDIGNWSDTARATLFAGILAAAGPTIAHRLSPPPARVPSRPEIIVVQMPQQPSPPAAVLRRSLMTSAAPVYVPEHLRPSQAPTAEASEQQLPSKGKHKPTHGRKQAASLEK